MRGVGVSVAPDPIQWPVVLVLFVPICNGGCGGVDSLAVLVCRRSFLGHVASVDTLCTRRGVATVSGADYVGYLGRWEVGLPSALDG